MAKLNVNEQLDRMNYLMGYGAKPINERKSTVEYHTVGADDKVYGIIKEGNTYYIKVGEKGKETLKESYEYINGFNYRNENGYKSYNEATKQLELKLLALNESYGVHKDVSTVDFKRGEKQLKTLTEEARKTIDRMNQIFENCQCIGKATICDPESKGKECCPEKAGEPFNEPTMAELDKDLKDTATVKDSAVGPEVSGVDSDLTSDKMKTKKVEPAEDFKDAHDDLDGDGLADVRGNAHEPVKINESNDDLVGFGEDEFSEDDLDDFEAEEEPEYELELDDESDFFEEEPEEGDEFEGEPQEEDEFEDIITEVEEDLSDVDSETIEEEVLISGDNKALTGKNVVKGRSEVKNGLMIKPVVLAEQIDEIVEEVCNEICGAKKVKKQLKTETIKEAISRIVKEEVQEFGKHPRFGKEPFTTPANKDVFVCDGDYEMDDASAKENVQYGKKIGKGSPFDEPVDKLIDKVVEIVKENLSKKA